MIGRLEHVNFTVENAKATAAMLHDLFGWDIRWEGEVLGGQGYTVHAGGPDDYVAIYQPNDLQGEGPSSYRIKGGLNHIGVVVDDIDATEIKVRARGYNPEKFADYEPGQRFYFTEENGIEIEVVSYA
ncbi:MAG: VOC family protein [Pseudomonadota bacterium]